MSKLLKKSATSTQKSCMSSLSEISCKLNLELVKSYENCGKVFENTKKIFELVSRFADLLRFSVDGGDTNLKCPLCSRRFQLGKNLPFVLPCGHSVCGSCLEAVRESSVKSICPLDQKPFINIENMLPKNFSLMTLALDPSSSLCQTHNSSLLSYCTSDQSLLCGRCLLSHSSHKVFELDSEEIPIIIKSKLLYWKNVLKLIIKIIEIWEKVLEAYFYNSRLDENLGKRARFDWKLQTEPVCLSDIAIKNILDINDLVICNKTQVVARLKSLARSVEDLVNGFEEMTLTQKLRIKTEAGESTQFPKHFDEV